MTEYTAPAVTEIVYEHPADNPDPMLDAAGLYTDPSTWHHWTSPHGDAWVSYIPGAPIYLLHDLHAEPRGEGHGAVLLTAVHLWADQHRLKGHLLCEPALRPWYEGHGWTFHMHYGATPPACIMVRDPQ